MTPFNLIILRLVMLSLGRFFPNLIRRILQKILITGKQSTPYQFSRVLVWQGDGWQITDCLTAESWANVVGADIGCDRTSIYVVMSRTFRPGQLQSAIDLGERVKNLDPGSPLKLTRNL